MIGRTTRRANERVTRGECITLLEGGYDLQGLSEGVTDSFRALLGEASGGDLIFFFCPFIHLFLFLLEFSPERIYFLQGFEPLATAT